MRRRFARLSPTSAEQVERAGRTRRATPPSCARRGFSSSTVTSYPCAAERVANGPVVAQVLLDRPARHRHRERDAATFALASTVPTKRVILRKRGNRLSWLSNAGGRSCPTGGTAPRTRPGACGERGASRVRRGSLPCRRGPRPRGVGGAALSAGRRSRRGQRVARPTRSSLVRARTGASSAARSGGSSQLGGRRVEEPGEAGVVGVLGAVVDDEQRERLPWVGAGRLPAQARIVVRSRRDRRRAARRGPAAPRSSARQVGRTRRARRRNVAPNGPSAASAAGSVAISRVPSRWTSSSWYSMRLADSGTSTSSSQVPSTSANALGGSRLKTSVWSRTAVYRFSASGRRRRTTGLT